MKNFRENLLGVLSALAVLLLLAISVFMVWGCAYVHWLLAAGVGCLLGFGWVVALMSVVRWEDDAR